jgi:hypothetical protein
MNKKLLILSLTLISSASAVSMPDWNEVSHKLLSVTMADVCDSAKHVCLQGKDLACEYGSKVLTGVKENYERVDAWTVAHPYKCFGGVVGAWALMCAIMWNKIQHRNACWQEDARGYDCGYDAGYATCKARLQRERYGCGNDSEEN